MCVVGHVVCVLGGVVLGVCSICGVCVVCVRWVWVGVAVCVWWGPGAGREVSRGHCLEIDTSKALHATQPGKCQVTNGRCGTNFL